MTQLPTMQQLTDRSKEAEKQLSDLKNAYDQFIAAWEKIEQDAKHITADIHTHIDKAKLERITQTISNINP